ncbi:MAG: hypothetical protein ACUVRC_08550 [Desulfotomaculales bacterium]
MVVKSNRRKVSVGGVEYYVIEDNVSVRLTRCDPATGLVVENVFAPRGDSRSRMESFKSEAAALVLEKLGDEGR